MKPGFRLLNNNEITSLVQQGNRAENWQAIYVTEDFSTKPIWGCEFLGEMYIENLDTGRIVHSDLDLECGLYYSSIGDCHIKTNSVIRNVKHLRDYVVESNVILFNIDEMMCTHDCKFGNGILNRGFPEESRIWIELCNEAGTRKILPFADIQAQDVFLWSRFRHKTKMMDAFFNWVKKEYTLKTHGTVGAHSVIKHCRLIKDVLVGPYSYIKGANKLKNITILSSETEKSQIGEGVEMVNGILGYGSRIFYGSKAVRFITGKRVQVKYGARLINSYVGDNSTVSCCEILNNFVYPFHEQHHNNSFLIASMVQGQSNIAADASLGSNHNSRRNDGEMVAARGFWPALGVRIKHNSRFSAYNLLTQGNYKEINNPLPFSLLSVNDNELTVMPGYWFRNNMYALSRNEAKFKKRDKRKQPCQPIEIRTLAQDTVSEIYNALLLIRKESGFDVPWNMLADRLENRDLRIKGIYKGCDTKIVHAADGVRFYIEALKDYALSSLLDTEKGQFITDYESCFYKWHNMGGMLVEDSDLHELVERIESGDIRSWPALHSEYKVLHKKTVEKEKSFALWILKEFCLRPDIDFGAELLAIKQAQFDRARASRQKDYDDPFRQATADSADEFTAVNGSIQQEEIIQELGTHLEQLKALLGK